MKRRRRFQPREVFVSHAAKDRRVVRRFVASLRAAGVGAWYSEHHLKHAQDWQEQIGAALDRCDWFVVLLSPNSIKSMWVKREVEYAVGQRRYQERLTPVLLERCDVRKLSWVLTIVQHIDASEGLDRGVAELLEAWGASTPARGRRSANVRGNRGSQKQR